MRQATARAERMSADQVHALWLQDIVAHGDDGAAQPADWQEVHDPTEPVEVTISKGTQRTKERCRRRKADARIWEAMSSNQERAAVWIHAALSQVLGDVAIRISRYEHGRRGADHSDDPEWQARVREGYRKWTAIAPQKGFVISDVIQILGHGETLREQDERVRQRKGRAKSHLLHALQEFVVLQCWERRDGYIS